MRGARGTGERAPHLLAAPDQAGGVVVGQRRVSDESNEIPALPDLLAPWTRVGRSPAPTPRRTRRGTAQWIISRGAAQGVRIRRTRTTAKRGSTGGNGRTKKKTTTTEKLIQRVVLNTWSESAAVMVCSNVRRGRR